MADERLTTCLMCKQELGSRDLLKIHLLRHLKYKKFGCNTCGQLFYTEEDRYKHCQVEGHFNAHQLEYNNYNEMLMTELMKDMEMRKRYSIDDIVMHRAKANATVHTNIKNCTKTEKNKMISPVNVKAARKSMSPMSRKNPLYQDTSESEEVETSPVVKRSRAATPDSNKKARSPSPHQNRAKNMREAIRREQKLLEAALKAEKARARKASTSSNDRMQIEMSPDTTQQDSTIVRPSSAALSGLSSATFLIGEALRTTNETVECRLCKKQTDSDYLHRKDHVSRTHMPNDHTDEDYVELLEEKMKKSFPMMTYSDLQCQIGGCGKPYKSKSSRRAHVNRCHFQLTLGCPITGCSVLSCDASVISKHLKEDHKVREGGRKLNPIEDYNYSTTRRTHNESLSQQVLRAFPCDLPVVAATSYAATESFKDMVGDIREKQRVYQPLPPMALRADSPSSTSEDDDDEEQEVPTSTSPAKHPTSISSGQESPDSESRDNKDARAAIITTPKSPVVIAKTSATTAQADGAKSTTSESSAEIKLEQETPVKIRSSKRNSKSDAVEVAEDAGVKIEQVTPVSQEREKKKKKKTVVVIKDDDDDDEPGADKDSIVSNVDAGSSRSHCSGSSAVDQAKVEDVEEVEVVAEVSPTSANPSQPPQSVARSENGGNTPSRTFPKKGRSRSPPPKKVNYDDWDPRDSRPPKQRRSESSSRSSYRRFDNERERSVGSYSRNDDRRVDSYRGHPIRSTPRSRHDDSRDYRAGGKSSSTRSAAPIGPFSGNKKKQPATGRRANIPSTMDLDIDQPLSRWDTRPSYTIPLNIKLKNE